MKEHGLCFTGISRLLKSDIYEILDMYFSMGKNPMPYHSMQEKGVWALNTWLGTYLVWEHEIRLGFEYKLDTLLKAGKSGMRHFIRRCATELVGMMFFGEGLGPMLLKTFYTSTCVDPKRVNRNTKDYHWFSVIACKYEIFVERESDGIHSGIISLRYHANMTPALLTKKICK